MSHHLAYRFKWYSKRESHMGTEIMTGFVEGKGEAILFT